MRRSLTLLVATVLLGLTGVAPAWAASTPPSTGASGTAAVPAAGSAGGASPSNGKRLAALNACLVAQKKGDVLILLDKSGSIANTDPTAQRIVAANALLQALTKRLTDTDSELRGAQLDVAVTTFGDTVFQNEQRVKPADTVWTPLDANSLPTLQGQVTQLAPIHDGLETNYWAALDWVTRAEEAHAGSSPVSGGCHLVFWFSDGRDGISPDRATSSSFPDGPTMTTPWTKTGTTEVHNRADALAVQGASEQDMQRAGGLSDRLRADGIVMVGIGLAYAADPQQLDLMQCITANDVVGDKNNAQCGALTAIGAFYPVDQAADLLLAVSTLGSSDTSLPPSGQLPVCARTVCASSHTFYLDSALRKVHVVGVASSSDPKVALTSAPTVVIKSPSGATATLQPGPAGSAPVSAPIGHIQLSYQWLTSNAISVDMLRPTDNDNWTGTWSVTFVDKTSDNPNAVARIQVSLSADLALTPQNPPDQAQQGEPFQVAIKLTSLNGGTAVVANPPPSMSGTVELVSAAAGDKTVTIASGSPSALAAVNWTVPDSVPLGPAKVRVSLVVHTTKLDLDPVVREFGVTVVGPKGSPTVDTSAIAKGIVDFGSIQGTDPATAAVPVSGPGCVWITGGDLSAHPADVTSMTIGGAAASPSSCVTLADGQHATVSVTATPGAAGNGQVRGTLVVHLARAGHAGDSSVPSQNLPYQLDMRRKPAGLVKWLVFAACLLVGIGLPILVLWLTRRLAARFPTDVQLVAARIPVLATPRALVTATGGTPDLPAQGDWSIVPPPTDGRRTLLVAGVSLRAKAGRIWSPTAGYAQAEDRPGTGSSSPYYGGPQFLARLPLGVQGSWAVLFRSPDDLAGSGADVAGDLLLISHPRTSPTERKTLLGEALSQGPELVSSLREAIRAARPVGGTGPGAVTPPPGPTPAGSGGAAPGPAGWGTGGGPDRSGSGPVNAPAAAPGWGSPPASGGQSAAPGWGSQPASAGQSAAPGWGSQPASAGQPAAPGWGSQPASGGPPPTSGWGSAPAGATAPGWGASSPGSPVASGSGQDADRTQQVRPGSDPDPDRRPGGSPSGWGNQPG